MRTCIAFASIALALAFPPHPVATWTSHEVTPWPKPAQATNGTHDVLAISKVSQLHITTASKSELLARAIERYTNIIENASPKPPLRGTVEGKAVPTLELTLNVDSDDESLSADTNVSYTLDVAVTGSASASSPTVFGALNALASFSQLVEKPRTGGLMMRGLPWAIADAPRFAHRGTLVDTARHFLPLDLIRQHIDALAWAKANVMHWHIVDSQAFPFNGTAVPALALGAWSPEQTYSAKDVAGIVAFAKDRGVRVMIEVDTPGHSASWGVGVPGVVADCPTVGVPEDGDGQLALDPSRNETCR